MKLKFKKLLLASLLALSITPTAFAETAKEQFQRANALYYKKEYHAAFKLYTELAEQGIEGVEYRLFLMYELGQGVRQDKQKAREWYEKSTQTRIKNLQIKVEQGDSMAIYLLALIYLPLPDYDLERAYQMYIDIPKGLDLLRKASEKGIGGASHSLGWHYLKGDVVRLDKVKAKEYFGLACDQGESFGCNEYKKLTEENK